MLKFLSISSAHTKSRNQSSNLYPITLFLIFRLLFTFLGLSLYLLGKVPLTADPITRPYFGIDPVVNGIPGAILGVWQHLCDRQVVLVGFIELVWRICSIRSKCRSCPWPRMSSNWFFLDSPRLVVRLPRACNIDNSVLGLRASSHTRVLWVLK